ncbi:MAG: helix-turn-helix domain-containing protein [Myxococcales bacterium]|nr:helix-turn-helix domain-containing protein [Myxococcales bacterium]
MKSSVPGFTHATNRRRHAALLQWRGWPSKIMLHQHEREAELGFVTAGTGHYSVGEDSFNLFPGRLFFIPPGVAHGSVGVDDSLHCWVLSIPRDRIEAVWGDANALGASAALRPKDARRLGRMLTDLAAESDDVAFDLGAEYVAASALAALESATSADDVPEEHRAVETATRLLRAESVDGPPLTLDKLAKRCGVSRSRLTALFRKEQGMSIVQFRNQERLQRCLALYAAQPTLGMARAAFAAGFGSYSQFYRTFCDGMGCTPAAYVRSRAPVSSAAS